MDAVPDGSAGRTPWVIPVEVPLWSGPLWTGSSLTGIKFLVYTFFLINKFVQGNITPRQVDFRI